MLRLAPRCRPNALTNVRAGRGEARRTTRRVRSTACGRTTKGQVPVDTRGWYVLVTSRSGKSVFARLGPYPTWELAERKARNSRLVHYRVESVLTSSARRQVAVRN